MIPKDFQLNAIRGKVFVVGENIDTDQIIPAHYLTLDPTKPEEYRKLGSYALCGLPDSYATRFVEEGKDTSDFTIIIADNNFGCGSSREHAPNCLGAAGCRVILAPSYARIFFRNCIATGELFPVEYDPETGLLGKVKTGDEVVVDLVSNTVMLPNGEVLPLRDPGAVREVILSGGIFEFARKSGTF